MIVVLCVMDVSDDVIDALNKRFDKQDEILCEMRRLLEENIFLQKQSSSEPDSNSETDGLHGESDSSCIAPECGVVLTNIEIGDRFKVTKQKGIRVSLKNKLIILMDSDKYKNLYDKENNILYYIGELKRIDREDVGNLELDERVKELEWNKDLEEEDPDVKGMNRSIRNRGGKEKFRIFYFRKIGYKKHICECEVKYHSYSKFEYRVNNKSIKIIVFKLKVIKNHCNHIQNEPTIKNNITLRTE